MYGHLGTMQWKAGCSWMACTGISYSPQQASEQEDGQNHKWRPKGPSTNAMHYFPTQYLSALCTSPEWWHKPLAPPLCNVVTKSTVWQDSLHLEASIKDQEHLFFSGNKEVWWSICPVTTALEANFPNHAMLCKVGTAAEKLTTSIPSLKSDTVWNLCAEPHCISRKQWQNWTAGPSTSCSTPMLLKTRWPETVGEWNKATVNPSMLPRHRGRTAGRPLPSTFSTEGHTDAAGYFSWADHESTLRSLRSRCRSSEPRTSCRMKISLYSQRLRCSSHAATSSVPQRWTVRDGKAGVHWVPRIPEDSKRWGHHQHSVAEKEGKQCHCLNPKGRAKMVAQHAISNTGGRAMKDRSSLMQRLSVAKPGGSAPLFW